MAGYSFETKDDMAKSSGRSLNVSMKQAIEICNHVRGRPLSQAKSLLQMAIDMKRPIPLKRFVNGVGHKHGMGPGRYYPKACQQILSLPMYPELSDSEVSRVAEVVLDWERSSTI